MSTFKKFLLGFGIFIVIGAIGSAFGGDDEKSEEAVTESSTNEKETKVQEESSTESVEEIPKEEEPEEVVIPEITFDEIKEQAQELSYKDLMRNPDDFTGQYFYVTVKISSAESGSLFSGYDRAYRAYTNDDYDLWMGDMIYLLDNRDTESDEYIKILEDDVITAYGRFDNLVETKNVLNGSKGEEMSLQLLYAELISE